MTPTDAEIAALRDQFGITSNGRGVRAFTNVADYTRAALAKWGTPTLVATKISIPTETMEQEFQNHYRRGYEAGKKAGTPTPAGAPVAWQIAAPFPGMNTPWTEEQKNGLQSALAEVFGWDAATSAPPVREPLDAAALAQRAKVGAIQTDQSDNVVLHRVGYRNQMEGRFERGWREAEKYHGITKGEPHADT